MRRRKAATETIVGIFVLASFALLFLVVVLIGRRQNIFEDRYEIMGVFNRVGGLQTGAEVHLAGISIGYVKDIRFSPKNKVEVIMSVSEDQAERIRQDSIASITTMGLMGDRYVEITIGAEEYLPIDPGGEIKTQEPFELGELLQEARPTISNMENAVRNISILTDELADPTGEVGTILENVKVLTTDLREGQGTLGALLTEDDIYLKTSLLLDTTQETMDNFKETSNNTKEAATKLPEIADQARLSIERFSEFADTAAESAVGISDMVDSGRDVMVDIKAVSSNLRSASEDIRDVSPRIGPLIDSADEGIDEAKKVIEAAKRSWLLRGYFQPTVPGEPIAISGRDLALPEVE